MWVCLAGGGVTKSNVSSARAWAAASQQLVYLGSQQAPLPRQGGPRPDPQDLCAPPQGPAGGTDPVRVVRRWCCGHSGCGAMLSGSDMVVLQLVWCPYPWSSAGRGEENGPCLRPCCYSSVSCRLGPHPGHSCTVDARRVVHRRQCPSSLSPRTAGSCSFAHLAQGCALLQVPNPTSLHSQETECSRTLDDARKFYPDL
jgi:hypothetical protein